ncbi:hypothetical protein ACRAWF_09080 [Streptomyces sp. L7]
MAHRVVRFRARMLGHRRRLAMLPAASAALRKASGLSALRAQGKLRVTHLAPRRRALATLNSAGTG